MWGGSLLQAPMPLNTDSNERPPAKGLPTHFG
jgi:hypothetical protein